MAAADGRDPVPPSSNSFVDPLPCLFDVDEEDKNVTDEVRRPVRPFFIAVVDCLVLVDVDDVVISVSLLLLSEEDDDDEEDDTVADEEAVDD